jgi:two-component system LytT family response regulator
MPYGTGFDLLEKIKPITFEVIFITAYNQYAIKAFKYNTIDYLLKPIDEDELISAVARAQDRIFNKTKNNDLLSFLANHKYKESTTKIGLPTQEGFVFINTESIIRCEADGAYSYVYCDQGKNLVVSKNLKELEAILDENLFCRVHHSHIINIDCVKKYTRGKGGEIEMEDGSIIQVSARKRSYFLEKYKLK